jgi:hypothetical protein
LALAKCNIAFPTIQSQNMTAACRAGKFDKPVSKRGFNKGFIENGLSTWMTQEAIQTSQLSIPFYKNLASSRHILCRADKNGTAVAHK